MASLNKVFVLGRLGRDPELRHTQSGVAVCNMSIATSEKYKDKSGEMQENTEWHKIVVWDKQAENAAKYLSKGDLAHVEGSLQTKKWQDKEGNDKYTTEIKAQRVTFVGSNGGGSGSQQPQQSQVDDASDIPF